MAEGICSREHTCVQCGKSFFPKRSDRITCCSRECGFDLKRAQAEPLRKIREAKAQFAMWARRARKANGWHSRHKAMQKAKWEARAAFPCVNCGKPVGVERTKIFPAKRCEECALIASKAVSRRSPSRRADKAYRKALARGKVAGSERFDPYEIFERDGWRCHLCGCRTPKNLRGSYAERAPELDHIVPLSQGGEHTRMNTACSCRRCNGAKGSRPLGQMRLIA